MEMVTMMAVTRTVMHWSKEACSLLHGSKAIAEEKTEVHAHEAGSSGDVPCLPYQSHHLYAIGANRASVTTCVGIRARLVRRPNVPQGSRQTEGDKELFPIDETLLPRRVNHQPGSYGGLFKEGQLGLGCVERAEEREAQAALPTHYG